MTIDIIAAAQADRKTKLDQILALQLDVIEIDAFIAKARAYAGEAESDAEVTTSEPSNSEALEAISGDLSTAPVAGNKALFTAPIREDRIERDREVIERRRRLGLV